MCPFFSLLPLSCEKAQPMEWDCQELWPHIPHHHGKGDLERSPRITHHPVGVGHWLPCPTSGLGQSRAHPRSLDKYMGYLEAVGDRERQGDSETGKAAPELWTRASPDLAQEVLPVICPDSLQCSPWEEGHFPPLHPSRSQLGPGPCASGLVTAPPHPTPAGLPDSVPAPPLQLPC